MRRMAALLLAAMMLGMVSCAQADTLDLLKPFWLLAIEEANRAKETPAPGQPQLQTAAPEKAEETPVTCADTRFEVLRSAVYLNDHYGSCEAHVYAELVNNSGETIPIDKVTVKVYDAKNRLTAEGEYATCAPEAVVPGGALYVEKWLYDFVSSFDKAARFEVEIEEGTYGYDQCEIFGTASAYTDGEYLYVEVLNDTQEPVFEIHALGVLQDESGRILDIITGNALPQTGIAPGSTMVFREMLEDHAHDVPGAAALGCGYLLSF